MLITVRVCALLTGSSTLGEFPLVTRCLVTDTEQSVGYLLLSSAATGSGSEWITWELRNIPQSSWLTAPCASPQGHVPAHWSQWSLQKLLCVRMTKPLTFADSKVTSLSWCLLHPSLLRAQPCSQVTWVQCSRVGTSVLNNQKWSIISEWME